MPEIGTLTHLVRHDRDQIVDLFQPLQVHFHAIEKNTIQGMPGNPRQGRVLVTIGAIGLLSIAADGNANYQHARRTQM